VSVVPSTLRSRHGNANITRPSTGEISVIARASGRRSRGNTMWTPFVRRSSGRAIGSSNRWIISSVHAPAARITARACTLHSLPVKRSRTATPVIRAPARSNRTTSV
jgi:hypothetical protein